MSKLTFNNKGELFLYNLIGYKTKNNVFEKAFIHKSFNKKKHNERLEFLGDRILKLTISHYLWIRYPDEDEGFMTRLQTKIENKKQR